MQCAGAVEPEAVIARRDFARRAIDVDFAALAAEHDDAGGEPVDRLHERIDLDAEPHEGPAQLQRAPEMRRDSFQRLNFAALEGATISPALHTQEREMAFARGAPRHSSKPLGRKNSWKKAQLPRYSASNSMPAEAALPKLSAAKARGAGSSGAHSSL